MTTLSANLNLSDTKPGLDAGITSDYHKYNAQNASYNGGSKMVIPISTGQANQFLLGSESFLEFELDVACSALTAGAQLRLDNSIYSCFGTIQVMHGGTVLSSMPYAGAIQNFLLNMSTTDRRSASLTVGASHDSSYDGALLVVGNAAGNISTGPRKFCVPLAGVPLVGSGSGEKATPLALLGSADLRVEIDLLPGNQVFTTGFSKGSAYDEDALGTNAEALTITYSLKNISYNAKVVNLAQDVMGKLMTAFQGQPVTIPSTAWYADRAYLQAEATGFSSKLAMQYSSLRAVYWWGACQDVVNGIPSATHKLGRANSQYACGALTGTWLSIGGRSVPSDRNTGLAGTTFPYIAASCAFHGASAYSSLLRCFNASTSVDMPASIHPAMYNTSIGSIAAQRSCVGKFAFGFDLERCDSTAGDSAYTGINTLSSPIDLHISYGSRVGTDPCTITMVGQYDVTYIIQQGQVMPAI